MSIEFEADEERIRRQVAKAYSYPRGSLAFDLDSLTQRVWWVESDVDVLAWHGSKPAMTSVLGLALALEKLVALQTSESVEFDTGGGTPDVLVARRLSDDNINIKSTNGVDVTFERDQFVQNARAFEEHVREYLLSVAPQLLNDPIWGWWFREEQRPRIGA